MDTTDTQMRSLYLTLVNLAKKNNWGNVKKLIDKICGGGNLVPLPLMLCKMASTSLFFFF